jgi:hypothetical protein
LELLPKEDSRWIAQQSANRRMVTLAGHFGYPPPKWRPPKRLSDSTLQRRKMFRVEHFQIAA